ncbi:MAG: hypothetical protein JST80_11380 [Bdellovibrionales bacterium]|nr:hypothetical protein [Bdellovibrionales bacterium]
MKLVSAFLIALLVQITVLTEVRADDDDPNFRQKLSQAIEKTDQSAKLLRQQISQSQNAPFLPDLYVQLGDLMSQKALTLYYIQMERDSKLETDGTKAKVEDSKPVVDATKEAIQIYELVIREFPKYPKKAEVSYKLALSLKSIEETAKFIAVASHIQEEFPNTEESMRAGLLLGRHYLDAHEWEDSTKYLVPISESKYNYEKNLAKYWLGLVSLGKEKYKEALNLFETVIEDKELKEQENPYDIKKGKGKLSKTDLKREALIDSIRAYTFVFAKDPNPVEYYSRLAPTEIHFQEVMEKLAVRYVLMKQYNQSVKVLRTMSERTADPQRVINVYREILLLIPMAQRLSIPVEEMRFVVQKFAQWRSYFNLPPKVLSDAYWFFEKQVRDVGTRNHDMAKTEKNPARKRELLEQGRDYYILYDAFFNGSSNSVKMATNLADTYYLLGNFFESGETYLKIFDGYYGKTPNRRALIENSILSLQKDKNDAFYPKVRSKGVLLRAINSYQALVPAKKRDDELEFLRLKLQYEQGFVPQAIEELFAFMRPRKNTKKGKDAGELILDYFNTLNDFTGLEYWADKILALRVADGAFVAKVQKIKKQAKDRVVEEKIKTAVGYDAFSQGKSYLAAAMSSNDETVKNAVLQEALAKSKAEKDIQTFFEAARLMAKKESNPNKRVAILRSIAQENMKVGRFYHGIEQLKVTSGEPGIDKKTSSSLWEDAVNTAVILHDRSKIRELIQDPRFAQTSSASKNRIREQMADALDSPMELTDGEAEILFRIGLSEESLLGLYKAKGRLAPAIAARVDQEARGHCGRSSKVPLCQWLIFQSLEPKRVQVLNFLKTAPTSLQSLEGVAGKFMEMARQYQAMEGSADAHLETAISIRGREVYQGFAGYLTRVAAANPSLKNDIMAKANESLGSAKVYQQKCLTIRQKSVAANPAMKFCSATTPPSFNDMLSWTKLSHSNAIKSDPDSDAILNLRKSIFSAKEAADPTLKLAEAYLQARADHHAVAMANYGISLYPAREADFKAVMGCALVNLGYLTEANFHLRASNDYNGLKTKCSAMLRGAKSQ